MLRRFMGFVLAIVAMSGSGSSIIAQTASPVAAECQASPLVAEPAFPETPERPLTASPVAASDGQANVADAAVAAQVEQVIRSLAACLTDGNPAGVAGLASADFLGDAFGGGERLSRSDYLALASGAPIIPVRIETVGQPVYTGMRTVAADVELIAGNQLRVEQWTLVFRASDEGNPSTPVAADAVAQGSWLAHRIAALTPQPPEGATEVEVTLNEYTIVLEDRTLEGPDIVFQGRNAGAEAHEMLVLRLSGGAAIESLLRPAEGAFPAGIEIAGQVTLGPGDEGGLVLVGLSAGEYHIVCLFPDTSGVPHLAFGQVATFAVR